MADRILHWHITGVLLETGVIDTDLLGDAYQMDKDYRVLDTWLRIKTVPKGEGGLGIQVDINDDGTSIYGEAQEPVLPDNTQEAICNTFSSKNLVLQEGSIITLDVDEVGEEYSGKDLVVELYLEKA